MQQIIPIKQEFLSGNVVNDCPPPAATNNNLDQQFFNDLKVIARATKAIKNQTVNKKILEFYLSALIARYAEYKISCLIETNLTKSLNQLFHYGRESNCSTS